LVLKHPNLNSYFKSELAANAIKEQGISTPAAAIQKHHETGEIVRNAITQAGSPMPEDLPTEPSIKPLLNARKHHSKRWLLKLGSKRYLLRKIKKILLKNRTVIVEYFALILVHNLHGSLVLL
jgi:hypothetical protein